MEVFEDMTNPEKLLCTKATLNKVPIYGVLELTPLCNMNCEMCYVRLSPEEMNRQGRLRTVEEWLDLAGQMKEEGVLFLLLTGGEPLLYPGFRQLYLGLKEMGMILTVNTNGTLLDEEWAEFFANHIPRRINITLYGTNRKTYEELCHYPAGFEKALNAIKLLNERNVSVKMNGSLVSANREDKEAWIQLAESLNTAYKIDTYMYPANRERSVPFKQQSRMTPYEAARARIELMKQQLTTEEFHKAAKQIIMDSQTPAVTETSRKVRCRAGRSSFVINWQGNMRPCVMLSVPSVYAFENGFSNAWKSIVEATDQIRLSSKCSACNLRKICQTCAACAMLESGSFDGVPEYMCQYTKESLALFQKEIDGMPVIQGEV